jgi:DNA repair ATPase RecN
MSFKMILPPPRTSTTIIGAPKRLHRTILVAVNCLKMALQVSSQTAFVGADGAGKSKIVSSVDVITSPVSDTKVVRHSCLGLTLLCPWLGKADDTARM